MGDRHTITVSATPTIEYWALVDHFFEAGRTDLFDKVKAGGLGKVADKFLDPALSTPIKEQALTTERNPGFWTAKDVTRDKNFQPLVDKHIGLAATKYESLVKDWAAKKQMKKSEADHQLKLLKKLPELVRFAVVDLTADPKKPLFAGNTEKGKSTAHDLATEQTYGASMVKMAAMCAAYQLLYDMNVLAKKKNIKLASNDAAAKETAKEQLFRAAWESWVLTQQDGGAKTARGQLEIQRRLVMAKGKKIPLAYNAGTREPWSWKKKPMWTWNGVKTWRRTKDKKEVAFIDGAPNLESIFDVVPGTPMTVQFKMGKTPVKDGFAVGEHGNPSGHPFYERMFAMIDASNNYAAGSCILDVGYLYIGSTLMQLGLFSPERGGGMWLAGTYTKMAWPTWVQCPLPVSEGGNYQVVSPAAATALMTLIAQGNLVSPAACREMLFLLNKKKDMLDGSFEATGTRSPVQDDLVWWGRDPDRVFSKLGIGDVGQMSDCALVERTVFKGTKSETTLRYVVSFVNLSPKNAFLTVVLNLALDNAVHENNKLPVP